ncbi:Globin-like protein 9 [Parelaphostrongylus tenuis]|uniref:Globin-like protein 9 n=1 Tax=Parelaphostrongylus tenuis TaxID=148309 RepID=A0AAD5LUT0_PARTN|nr:Globin-like protein 9 [Parelaphostrongylus tenuis]
MREWLLSSNARVASERYNLAWGEDAIGKSTLSSIASLSFSQKQALTASWRMLRAQAPNLFRKIFLELEVVSSKVKQIFYKALCVDAFNKDEENIATMDVHVKLMVKFFDDLLVTLDNEAECIDRMKRIGSSHAVLARTCGFTSDIWERLGEIAMERICSHEIVQKTREAARAWRILLACVIDEFRGGFDGEARYHRRTSSVEELDNVDDEVTKDIHEKMRQLRLEYESTVPYQ